ncbi:MAG: flippase-like domain-containing protein [Ignavibacteriales bacterium]|nr:flippase-like domain-containing protein [Ignavibacteriales bacterium]MCF8435853.1 flippase-like domain-containing protein [Ignavibacteriales bacterium]
MDIAFIRIKYIKISFTIATLVGLYLSWNKFYSRYYNEINSMEWTLNYKVIVFTTVIYSLGYFIRSMLWAPLRYEFTNQKMAYWQAFVISAKSWMGRYIPGKIWAFVGKTALSSSSGKDIGLNFAATMTDMFIFLVSGLILGSLSLFMNNNFSLSIIHQIIVILTLVIGFIALFPESNYRLINFTLKLFNQDKLKKRVSFKRLLFFFISNLLTLIFWGLSFVILLNSITPISLNLVPLVISIYSLSWVLGIIVVFAPAGIGIREGILIYGLSSTTDIAVTNIFYATVLIRLVSVFVEVISFVISIIIEYLLEKNKK